jgi:hypothetical protein
MDKKTVFVKTDKGESEVGGQSDALYGDAKRILHLVDDESTVGDISKRAPPSLREELNNVLQELVDGGYIRDMRAPVNVPQKSTLKFATPSIKMATPKAATPAAGSQNSAPQSKAAPIAAPPPKITPASPPSRSMPDMAMPDMVMPTMPPPDKQREEPAKVEINGDLDFSFITAGSSPGKVAAGATDEKTQAEAKARQAADAARLKAEQSAQIEAVAKAAKLKAYEEAKVKAKIDVAAKARIEADARQNNEAVAARLKAEQDALKMRAELEATKARADAEVRARIEAEIRVKQEVEAARLKAERDAEKIRLELIAAKIKAEAEIRSRLEAEARVKAEVEARMKREAEAERLRIEKERAELEVARIKAEAEIRLRTEAELRFRAEVEARLKAEELAKYGDRLSHQDASPGGAGLHPDTGREEQVEQAEKLRQSFVDSFGKDKAKQAPSPFNFKLDTFSSLNDLEKMASTIAQPKKPEVLPGAGSKVKAAIELRAKKEAEAQRLKAQQEAEAPRIKAEQEAEAQRAKAEQEATRLRAMQEQEARIKAGQESIRLNAEHEAYRLKTEQQNEQKNAEIEAQKLTDQQSKQWEEAQRRAAVQAQAEKERLARQSAEEKAKAKLKPARVRRKPLPIGRMVASLFALALIAVAGLPYVWPLDEYIAPLEKEISAQLNKPIKISKINAALLPLPKLVLHNLAVGSAQELKVAEVVLNFDISALFATTRSINKMELSNVTLTGASLDKVLVWLQAVGGNDKYPVARMDFHGVRVSGDEIKLPLLHGRADFDAQGKFTRADVKSEDLKFGIELQSQQNRLQLELNIRDSSLPILKNIKFNDLSASGLVENGEFTFADFFAHIHGGTITGKGQLNWNNGWKLQGQLNAKSLELKNMFPNFGVAGELYGNVSVSMHGATLSQLDKDPRMEGAFEAKNGVISKLDIDTTARFGSRKGVAGHTDFSELSGTLKADNNGQRFYLNKISAGAVSGSGMLEVDEQQQLSGKLLVELKGSAGGSVPLQLSGTPREPLLQPGN